MSQAPENNSDEDPETQAYRMKIEEQKRIREKILRLKEERRKAALKGEVDAEAIPPSEAIKKPEILQNIPAQTPSNENIKKQTNPNIIPVRRVVNSNQNVVKNVTIQPQTVMFKSNANNQRIVVKKEAENAGLNSFLNNRTVILKDQSLPDTSVVVISNLAAGTSEVKLRKLCQSMGEIQVRIRIFVRFKLD